jgi:adenylosuccinate lyase
VIPKDAARIVWEKGRNAKFDVERIDEIEREVKHDVIAFLTHLAEIVGPGSALRAPGHDLVDVLDTCLAVQLARAAIC